MSVNQNGQRIKGDRDRYAPITQEAIDRERSNVSINSLGEDPKTSIVEPYNPLNNNQTALTTYDANLSENRSAPVRDYITQFKSTTEDSINGFAELLKDGNTLDTETVARMAKFQSDFKDGCAAIPKDNEYDNVIRNLTDFRKKQKEIRDEIVYALKLGLTTKERLKTQYFALPSQSGVSGSEYSLQSDVSEYENPSIRRNATYTQPDRTRRIYSPQSGVSEYEYPSIRRNAISSYTQPDGRRRIYSSQSGVPGYEYPPIRRNATYSYTQPDGTRRIYSRTQSRSGPLRSDVYGGKSKKHRKSRKQKKSRRQRKSRRR